MTTPNSMGRPVVCIISSVDTLRLAAALAARLEPEADVRLLDAAALAPESGTLRDAAQQITGVDLVVAILGPDDFQQGSGARRDVLFELGLAVGALGAGRLVIAADSRSAIPPSLHDSALLTVDLSALSAPDTLAAGVLTHLSHLGFRPKPSRESVTVFLSYASTDREFVVQLGSDLTAAGISCWFARDVESGGQHWAERLAEGLTASDRLLVVLSTASIESAWLQQEVHWARDREKGIGYPVLFPVIVDSADISSSLWLSDLLVTHQVADFSDWKIRQTYERSLRRLLQSLSISADPSYSSWV